MHAPSAGRRRPITPKETEASPSFMAMAGDDGVHRPLAGPEFVRMAFLKREAAAPVLQRDPGFRRHDLPSRKPA